MVCFLMMGAMMSAQTAPKTAKPKVVKASQPSPGNPKNDYGNLQLPSTVAPGKVANDAVAVLNGRGYTKTEIETLIRILVPKEQQAAMMADPKYFLIEMGRMQVLAADAIANKLPEKSPYRERYYISQLQQLANMQLGDLAEQTFITPEQTREFYDKNIKRWQGVKIRGIYLPFQVGTPKPESKTMTEAESLALAEKIVEEARGGKDFVALVKEHSRDEVTKAKDGDYGLVRRSDSLPEELMLIVFQLKQGEVSKPIKQSNGYYLFQVYELVNEPFEKVQSDVFKEMKDLLFQRYIADANSKIDLKIMDEKYFEAKPPEATPAAPNVK
jgi:peptidyl-prolyl cis-trans isomerase C